MHTHHEQVLVDVQVAVVVPAPVLDGLGDHRALALSVPVTARRGQRGPPQTLVEGHADGVEAPGELVPRGSEAAEAQLDRLGKLRAAVGLVGGQREGRGGGLS